MNVVRDARYEYQEENRASEIDPFLRDLCADMSHMYDDMQRQIRKLQESQRYGNTGAARSYLAQASASVADALDSVRAAREALR